MAKSYSDKLKSPKWQKKRLEIMERDGFKCKLCGDEETQLQVHHKKYSDGNPWDANSKDLITLCKHCHDAVTVTKDEGGLSELSAFHSDIKLDENIKIKVYKRKRKNYAAFHLYDIPSGGLITSIKFDETLIQSIIKLIDNE